MATWRFDALTGAALEAAGGSVPLERKAAALLLVVSCSGPTPRSRLAGLLWPGSPEATARTNLAQALRRLRRATGAEIVVGDAWLELAPDLRCDLAASVGDDAVDVLGSRALLAAHDYDDCAELAEWLEIERQRMLRHHLARLHDEAEGLEATGDARAALQAYERIVALEPADEAARCFEVVGAASDAFTAAEATVTLRFVAGVGGLGAGAAPLARLARSPDEKARAPRRGRAAVPHGAPGRRGTRGARRVRLGGAGVRGRRGARCPQQPGAGRAVARGGASGPGAPLGGLRAHPGAGALGDVVGGREQPGSGSAGARTAGGG